MSENFYVDYLERLDQLLRDFQKEIRDLPAEAMDWSPGTEMNSAAVLLAHTAGSLRYWIGEAALGEPAHRDRESEFQTRGVSGEELIRRIEAVVVYAKSKLPQLNLTDVQAETTVQREGKPVSRGWALLHALEHGYLHLGHVQLTGQLWRQREEVRR